MHIPPASSCLYVYYFNSLHLFVEQKGDFVELFFIYGEDSARRLR